MNNCRIKNLINKFADFLYPDGLSCLDCGAEIESDELRYFSLCGKCVKELPVREGIFCSLCGEPVATEEILSCEWCSREFPYYDKVLTPYHYSGVIRKIIISYKEYGKTFLYEYMAKHLYEYFLRKEKRGNGKADSGQLTIDGNGNNLNNTSATDDRRQTADENTTATPNSPYSTGSCQLPVVNSQNLLKADFVTFVPSSKKTIRRRGFDHLKKVAEKFCSLVEIEQINPLEKLIEPKRQQKQLNRAQRFFSVQGKFSLKNDFPVEQLEGKTVILLDDVVTTTATVNECAKVLKDSGADSVIVLALARHIL